MEGAGSSYEPHERPMTTDPDSGTVARFKGGALDAFDDLINKYQDRIYGFLYRLCGNPEGAAGVTQETFLNAFKYLKGFRGETSFRNWLYKVAASSCYRSKRKRKDEPDFQLSIEQFFPGSDRPKFEIPDITAMPEERLLNGELSAHIEKTILALPKKYRIVLVLRDLEGLTTEETSTVLDISPAAVKSRLHRARLFAKERLADYFLS